MKYLKKYESHEGIHAICKKYDIKNYTINADGSIDVNVVVNLANLGLTKLPLKFNSVGHYFNCNDNRLTSLEGCPTSVSSTFYCHRNRLTSLKGCPKSIGDDFVCTYNDIETFEGLDFVYIGNNFYCHNNPIYRVWALFWDHTKFEFFNDCDPIRENRVIIIDRLNFFLDYINKPTVTEVEGYKCI